MHNNKAFDHIWPVNRNLLSLTIRSPVILVISPDIDQNYIVNFLTAYPMYII